MFAGQIKSLPPSLIDFPSTTLAGSCLASRKKSGIFPVSRLSLRSRMGGSMTSPNADPVRIPMLPQLLGMVPVNELFLKMSTHVLKNIFGSEGRQPMNLLFSKSRTPKLGRNVKTCGNLPENLLLPIPITRRLYPAFSVRLPLVHSPGSSVNKFLRTSSVIRDEDTAKLDGSFPLSLLFSSSTVERALELKDAGGTSPVKLFLRRLIKRRADRLDIESGSWPLSLADMRLSTSSAAFSGNTSGMVESKSLYPKFSSLKELVESKRQPGRGPTIQFLSRLMTAMLPRTNSQMWSLSMLPVMKLSWARNSSRCFRDCNKITTVSIDY